MIETIPTTEQLLAAWREAQLVVNGLRLDAPDRAAAEDRLHDARNAYQDRVSQQTAAGGDDPEPDDRPSETPVPRTQGTVARQAG